MAKTTTKTDKPAAKAAKPAAKSGGTNALQTPVNISDDLAAIVGKGPLPRGQVTAKLWEYIKAKKLQSKTDGRQIEPDAALAKVIGKDSISMFKMTAAVNKHFS